MAYKFQIGAARLSGSIIQSDGTGDLRATTVDSLNASNGGIAAAGAIAGATTISGSGALTALSLEAYGLNAKAAGISNAGAIAGATTVAASGLASLDGGINVDDNFTVSTAGAVVAVGVNAGGAITGATTIAASSNATIEGIVSGAAGTFDALAGTSLALQTGGITAAGAIAGASTVSGSGLFSAAGGLNAGSGRFTVSTAGAVVAASLNNGSGGITNAGAIAGATTIDGTGDLTMGTITMSGFTVDADGDTALKSLAVDDGSTIGCDTQTDLLTVAENLLTVKSDSQLAATFVGVDANNRLEFDTSNNLKIKVNGAERLRFNDTGNTIIKGDLLVEGTTTTIDSTTINVSRSFTFEGPASDFETVFGYAAADAPIQDISVILPEYSSSVGAHTVKAAVISNTGTAAEFLAASVVTAAEMAVLDGGTADSSVTIADADQMIINDNGTMKQTAMSDVKSYVGSGISETVKDLSGNNTPVAGVNYYASNLTSTQAVTLPASAAMSVGQKVRIKAPSDCSNSVKVVISRAGSQLMDGSLESISLESPFAAVELVYVAANTWRIF